MMMNNNYNYNNNKTALLGTARILRKVLAIGYGLLPWCNIGITSTTAKALPL